MRALQWTFTTLALGAPLAACTPSSPGSNAGSQAQAPQAREANASSGLDLAAIDRSVQPGDDFFSYANGNWFRTTEIPANRSRTGAFVLLGEKAEQRTADLIRDLGATNPAEGTNARKVADSYAAFMNEDAIERRGLDGLAPLLEAIEAVKSRADLARVLGERLRADVDPINSTNFYTDNLFGLFVTQALEDPSRTLAYLLQGGLAMPSRDYYLDDDPAMRGYREKYATYVASMLTLAGTREPQKAAAAIVDLETKIAKAHATLVESEDVHAANIVWKPADFPANAPGLDWGAFFAAAGLADQPGVDVWQPTAIKALSKLTAEVSLDSWKALLRFHTLDHYAPWLPKAYVELAFDFHQRTLFGVPEQRERWRRAVAVTSNDLGDAVGRLYVERYFPASSKAQIEAMVTNIVAAFRTRIDTLAWMAPATKANAKAKLATLRVGIGYPDTWEESSPEVRADDALGNHLRAEAHYLATQKAKLGRAPDHGEWWMTPQTVNAVNLPVQNALNFPAAILDAPFFDPSADPAANYGAIGSVIGHEVSHSFDNLGAEFDGDGRLQNWWTAEDAEHFKAAGKALADQYDAYEALPGLHLNGQQTLGENIADLAGLQVAHLAYEASLGGKPAPVIDGMSPEQRFFLAYAQVERSKAREGALRAAVNTDVHAPGQFRAVTVRNLDEWYAAFDVKPGMKAYLAPGDRVRIW